MNTYSVKVRVVGSTNADNFDTTTVVCATNSHAAKAAAEQVIRSTNRGARAVVAISHRKVSA